MLVQDFEALAVPVLPVECQEVLLVVATERVPALHPALVLALVLAPPKGIVPAEDIPIILTCEEDSIMTKMPVAHAARLSKDAVAPTGGSPQVRGRRGLEACEFQLSLLRGVRDNALHVGSDLRLLRSRGNLALRLGFPLDLADGIAHIWEPCNLPDGKGRCNNL